MRILILAAITLIALFSLMGHRTQARDARPIATAVERAAFGSNLDTDADGCPDSRELGSDWRTGGQRDPNNGWDFFDVPVPVLTSADHSGTRDKAIAANDQSAVVYYIGTATGHGPNGNGVSYDSDLNSNGIPDGREYDRTGASDPNQPWRSGAPNGAVSINDAIAIGNQIGSNCNVPTCAAGKIVFAEQCVWIASMDTMKLSKDNEGTTYGPGQIAQIVNLMATEHVTHITVDSHYDKPDVEYQWITAIRAAGKHVWFRGSVRGWGGGTVSPTDWLTAFATWIDTYANNPSYPNFFQAGDILDPNAEGELGFNAWCACNFYSNSTQRDAWNRYLRDTVLTADSHLASHGFSQGTGKNQDRDILTTVHSINRGDTIHNLYAATVMDAFDGGSDGLVTVDAYPDQSTTDPATAATAWANELACYHSSGCSGGGAGFPSAKILLGEIGYKVGTITTDTVQHDVLAAEMHTFHDTTLPLVGINYWVGPGWDGSGDHTYIMCCSIASASPTPTGGFTERPGAPCVGALFDEKNGGTTALC